MKKKPGSANPVLMGNVVFSSTALIRAVLTIFLWVVVELFLMHAILSNIITERDTLLRTVSFYFSLIIY